MTSCREKNKMTLFRPWKQTVLHFHFHGNEWGRMWKSWNTSDSCTRAWWVIDLSMFLDTSWACRTERAEKNQWSLEYLLPPDINRNSWTCSAETSLFSKQEVVMWCTHYIWEIKHWCITKKAGKLVIPIRKTVHFSTPFVISLYFFFTFYLLHLFSFTMTILRVLYTQNISFWLLMMDIFTVTGG